MQLILYILWSVPEYGKNIAGEVDDENLAPDDRDWDQYWRLLFKKITVDDIKNFEESYKGMHKGWPIFQWIPFNVILDA